MTQLFVLEHHQRPPGRADRADRADDGARVEARHDGLATSDGAWCTAPLDAPVVALVPEGRHLRVRPVEASSLASAAAEHSRLLVAHDREADKTRWFVLAREAVAINGRPVASGIAALDHGDEVRAGAARAYFSLERPARVERHVAAGDTDELRCPRCQLAIEDAQAVVRCPAPQCGVLHHEDAGPGLPCWSDFDRCATCTQPTALDGGLRWTPEAP